MRLSIDVHLHLADETVAPILAALAALRTEVAGLRVNIHAVQTGQQTMSAELDRLSSEVAENTSAVDSAVTLLANLSALIRANATDPAALNKLADDLDANSNRLAAAVTENTPSAEPA